MIGPDPAGVPDVRGSFHVPEIQRSHTRPLVYVASPITGDPWRCVPRAVEAAAWLCRQGIDSHLPQLSVLHEMIDPQPYGHWINHGLRMVARCDGLVRLTGDSPGADREADRADELGLPVIALDHLKHGARGLDDWLWNVRAHHDNHPIR